MLLGAFHWPLRVATALLALAGSCLGIVAAIAAMTHADTAQAGVFAIVTVVLAFGAAMLLRGNKWAILIAVVGLGGQWGAVAARTWELVHGVDQIKARQLQHLGFDPTTGVIINLVYSSIAAILFCWFAVRYLAMRRITR